MSDQKYDLPALLAAYNEAMDAFTSTDRAARDANNNKTVAQNNLNAAQRSVDAAMAEIKKKAPWGTDWSESTHRSRELYSLPETVG